MRTVTIRKGLDLPLSGEPAQQVSDGPDLLHVAVIAADFPGMKPRFLIKEGQAVRRGQPLFEDRKVSGVLHTAPAAGTVAAINRGARRALQSVVIELSDAEQAGSPADDAFATFDAHQPGVGAADMTGDQVKALMLQSGLWTGLRARPYDRTPAPDTVPAAILVSAMDTRPHAPKPETVLGDRIADFHQGLVALSKLCEGNCWLTRAKGSSIDAGPASRFQLAEFSGPHPAGLVGTQLHFLDPVHRQKAAWHMGYQDVTSLGATIRTGRLDVTRVVALSGPPVKTPRLLRTRLGASTVQLTAGQLADGDLRIISGDVLSGRKAGDGVHGFLGRFDNQVSVLVEERERVMFGWLMPGLNKFSTIPSTLGGLLPGRKFAMGTSTNGEHRAIVPIGMYERVMPLDIEPTILLRALQAGDIEGAEKLGALELTEEDLGLCAYVCPNKVDHQGALRNMLDVIWKESA